MDQMHRNMVKKMEEREDSLDREFENMMAVSSRKTSSVMRKTSVSTACQTDKV